MLFIPDLLKAKQAGSWLKGSQGHTYFHGRNPEAHLTHTPLGKKNSQPCMDGSVTC